MASPLSPPQLAQWSENPDENDNSEEEEEERKSDNEEVNQLYKAMIRGDKMACKSILLSSTDQMALMNATAKIVAHDVSLEAGVPPEQTYGNVIEYLNELTGRARPRTSAIPQTSAGAPSQVKPGTSEPPPPPSSPRPNTAVASAASESNKKGHANVNPYAAASNPANDKVAQMPPVDNEAPTCMEKYGTTLVGVGLVAAIVLIALLVRFIA